MICLDGSRQVKYGVGRGLTDIIMYLNTYLFKRLAELAVVCAQGSGRQIDTEVIFFTHFLILLKFFHSGAVSCVSCGCTRAGVFRA